MTGRGEQSLWSRYRSIWDRLSGWKLFLFYALHYTVLFTILCPLIFSAFRTGGKTLIWTQDGMPQHFTRLVYLSQTIRDGIQSLLSGNGWTIPLYDFRLGPAELELQVEPVQWLAVLWPWDKIDTLYNILVVLRYYLTGLSFMTFGYCFRQRPLPVLTGAVSYTFCGFAIYAGVRHPFFLAPMIYLPLLITGTEKVLRRERPYLLTVVVFLALTSSLYFSCMLAIITVAYALLRFFTIYEKDRWKEFGRMTGRLAASAGTGIALSGVVMLPTLLQMLGTGRIGRDVWAYTDPLKYADTYYQKFLLEFQVIPGDIGGWVCLGFSLLTVPALLMLFVRRKKVGRILRWAFIVLTVMLMLPAVGYVMSGFNVTNNRWCFSYAFCCAAILMFELPQFLEADRHELSLVGILTVVYFAICYLTSTIIKDGAHFVVPAVLLATAFAILMLCCMGSERLRASAMAICLAITCLSTWYSAYLMYDPDQIDYVSAFAAKGAPYPFYEQSQYGTFASGTASKADDGFYRVAGSDISRQTINASFFYGINGLSWFSSMYYTDYMDWCDELEHPHYGDNITNYGILARSPMLSLANVKYYVLRTGAGAVMPYGFEEVDQAKTENAVDLVLKNRYALPVGYTYDSYLPRDEYEPLMSLQKQEAQLQAVVLDGTPASSDIEAASPTYTAQQVPAEILDAQDVAWSDGKLRVTADGATMTLGFSGLPNTETYLRVVGLDLTSGGSTRRWVLTAKTEDITATARFTADAYLYSHGQKTQLLNLGYSEEGYTTVTLTFPQKGTFILDDLQIWCQPMDQYSEQIDALRAETLEDVETNWRGLTGHISVSRDKILCIAVPYDTGWSAYVDGEKAELFRANTAFMGVELPAGEHTVELKYWTLGLTGGIALSALGLVGLVCLIVWRRKDKTK